MKKITEFENALKVCDVTIGFFGGPGSAQESAWKIVRRAAVGAQPPQATNTASLKCPACGSIYIWFSANGNAVKCDVCGNKWSRTLQA